EPKGLRAARLQPPDDAVDGPLPEGTRRRDAAVRDRLRGNRDSQGKGEYDPGGGGDYIALNAGRGSPFGSRGRSLFRPFPRGGRPNVVERALRARTELPEVRARLVQALFVCTAPVVGILELNVVVLPEADRANAKRSGRLERQSSVSATGTGILPAHSGAH